MPTCDVSIIALGRDFSNARLQRIMRSLKDQQISYEVFTKRGGRIYRVIAAWIVPWRAKGKVLFTPDPESAIAISYIARFRRKKWAVDVREDYKLLIEDRSWAKGSKKVFANLLAEWAVSASASADLTITVDDWVKPLTAKNRIVVHNAPDSRFLPEPTEVEAKPRAIYVGDVRTSRGLFSMLRSIEMTEAWTLDVVGNVAPDDQAKLAQWQKNSSAASRVRFHGALAPKDSWQLAKGAWVGLALLNPTPAFNRAWPTKIGEYIACGLPVIATDLPRSAEVILKDPRPGALVETLNEDVIAMQTAGILNSWAENPDQYQKIRESTLLNVERWRSAAGYDRIAREIFGLIQ